MAKLIQVIPVVEESGGLPSALFGLDNVGGSAAREYSEATAQAIDGEIARILDAAHRRVRETLTARRSALEALAKLLIDKEVIDADQFATHEASTGEHVQVLRDGLACHPRALGQADDGHGTARAQSSHEPEPRRVAERREHRRGVGEATASSTPPWRHSARSTPSALSSPRRSCDMPARDGRATRRRTRTPRP